MAILVTKANLNYAVGEIAKKVKALDAVIDGKVTTLIGSDSAKSVRTIANEELAAQLIPASAKESLDTLQEIAAWIQAHPDDVSSMNAKIKANEDAITKLNGAATVEGSVAYSIAQAIGEADLSQIAANKAAIETLNGTASTDGSVLKMIATERGLIDTELAKKVDKVEGSSLITATDLAQIGTNKSAIETLNGADTVAGSVAKTVKDYFDTNIVALTTAEIDTIITDAFKESGE